MDCFSLAPCGQISLTKSEEYLLIARSRNGDSRAEDRLSRSMYLKLERHIYAAGNWISALAPLEDLLQEGMFGFREALKGFDPSYGTCFWTYFRWKAGKYILDYLDREYRKHGKTDWDLSLDWLSCDGDSLQIASDDDVFGSVEAELMTERYNHAIREALSPLPWIERKTIALKFALGWSYSQISRHLDVPISTASWRVRKAIDGLRDRLESILNRPVTLEELGVTLEPIPEPPEDATPEVSEVATLEDSENPPPESSDDQPPDESGTSPAAPSNRITLCVLEHFNASAAEPPSLEAPERHTLTDFERISAALSEPSIARIFKPTALEATPAPHWFSRWCSPLIAICHYAQQFTQPLFAPLLSALAPADSPSAARASPGRSPPISEPLPKPLKSHICHLISQAAPFKLLNFVHPPPCETHAPPPEAQKS